MGRRALGTMQLPTAVKRLSRLSFLPHPFTFSGISTFLRGFFPCYQYTARIPEASGKLPPNTSSQY